MTSNNNNIEKNLIKIFENKFDNEFTNSIMFRQLKVSLSSHKKFPDLIYVDDQETIEKYQKLFQTLTNQEDQFHFNSLEQIIDEIGLNLTKEQYECVCLLNITLESNKDLLISFDIFLILHNKRRQVTPDNIEDLDQIVENIDDIEKAVNIDIKSQTGKVFNNKFNNKLNQSVEKGISNYFRRDYNIGNHQTSQNRSKSINVNKRAAEFDNELQNKRKFNSEQVLSKQRQSLKPIKSIDNFKIQQDEEQTNMPTDIIKNNQVSDYVKDESDFNLQNNENDLNTPNFQNNQVSNYQSTNTHEIDSIKRINKYNPYEEVEDDEAQDGTQKSNNDNQRTNDSKMSEIYATNGKYSSQSNDNSRNRVNSSDIEELEEFIDKDSIIKSKNSGQEKNKEELKLKLVKEEFDSSLDNIILKSPTKIDNESRQSQKYEKLSDVDISAIKYDTNTNDKQFEYHNTSINNSNLFTPRNKNNYEQEITSVNQSKNENSISNKKHSFEQTHQKEIVQNKQSEDNRQSDLISLNSIDKQDKIPQNNIDSSIVKKSSSNRIKSVIFSEVVDVKEYKDDKEDAEDDLAQCLSSYTSPNQDFGRKSKNNRDSDNINIINNQNNINIINHKTKDHDVVKEKMDIEQLDRVSEQYPEDVVSLEARRSNGKMSDQMYIEGRVVRLTRWQLFKKWVRNVVGCNACRTNVNRNNNSNVNSNNNSYKFENKIDDKNKLNKVNLDKKFYSQNNLSSRNDKIKE